MRELILCENLIFEVSMGVRSFSSPWTNLMLGWHDTFFPSLYSSSLLSATTMVEYLASLASYDLQFYLPFGSSTILHQAV